MINGYRIVPFIPAGRKRTLEILFRYFQKNKDVVDEVMLWQNTPFTEDVDFLYETAKRDPMFKVYTLPEEYDFYYNSLKEEQTVKWGKGERVFEVNRPGDKDFGPVQWNTGRFFEYCTDPKTIYIRFDDDIVYLEDDYFQRIVEFRIKYPQYFLVFGNIWNNAIISYIHQQEGKIGNDFGTVDEPYCMDIIGWGSGEFAEYIHEIFFNSLKDKRSLDFIGGADCEVLEFMPEGYELANGHRFSISNFAFFGRDFAKFDGKFTDLDEEKFLTEVYPTANDRKSVICNALCVHFTFSPFQKPHIMNNTNLLKRYNDLSKQILSDSYYNLLNTHND